MCFRAENVFLPKGGYFGVSAATGKKIIFQLIYQMLKLNEYLNLDYMVTLGGLADDHDVLHFLTTSLHPLDQMTLEGRQVSQEDENKITKEYQDYQKKLEQQKEDYRKYVISHIHVLVLRIIILLSIIIIIKRCFIDWKIIWPCVSCIS